MTTADQTDRLKCADTLLSGHYRDITAKDIALTTAYSLADIAESLRTIASRPAIDPVEAAIETIARCILAGAAETAAAEGWERYPEIGERDWARVGTALEAVERLAARAEAAETEARRLRGGYCQTCGVPAYQPHVHDGDLVRWKARAEAAEAAIERIERLAAEADAAIPWVSTRLVGGGE